MEIKPHKNKTVKQLSKFDIKKINLKKTVAVLLLLVVIGFGIYGTSIGIKEEIEDKKFQDSVTTTEAPVINLKGKEKTFVENSIKITLTDRFEIFDDSAIEAGFVADGIEIYILKDSFEEFPEYKDYSEIEYARHLVEMNGDVSVEIKEIDDDVYLEYIFASEKGYLQAYVVKVSKETDCFLLSNFITVNSDALAYKEHIMKWAKTIEYVGE